MPEEDARDPAGPPDPENERIRARRSPGRSKRKTLGRLLRVVIVLAPIAAAGLGFSHAYSQWKNQPFPADSNFTCPPLPVTQAPGGKAAAGRKPAAVVPAAQQAAVSEQLDIRTSPGPFLFTDTEVVTLPTDNRLAQALMLQPGSAAARDAAGCLFTGDVNGVPQLTSAAHGMATFKDSGSATLPLGWETAVHPRGIQLQFEPEFVCNSFPYGDWSGTTLTLTVVSDTVLRAVAPQPDSVSGTTYVWRSPGQGCGKLPNVSVTVPTDLDGYLSSVVNASGSVAASALGEILGWFDPAVTGVIALWLLVRIPQAPGKRRALALVTLALLGMGPAAVDLTLGQSPLRGAAELVAFYIVALGLILGVRFASRPGKAAADADDAASDPERRPRMPQRVGLAMIGALSGAAAAVLVCAYRYPVWFPGAGILLTVAAAVLLLAVGMSAPGLAGAVADADADESRLSPPARAAVGRARDLIVKWVAVAALIALAYNATYQFQIGSVQSAVLSEFSILRYPLAVFGQVLVPIALVLPLSMTGNPGRRITAAAAFGLAMTSNQSDLLVGAGWGVPLGTVLMGVFAYALVREDDQPGAPRPGGAGDAVLAITVGGLLAVVPVGYFAFTTIASLSASQTSVFVVSSVLGQFTGWLVIAVFYARLSSRLPGRVGPLKALILAGVWFAVAIAVNLADNGLHFPTGRSWIFAGLQFSLFLIAFSVIWDALALNKDTVPETISELRTAYHLEQAQTVALYAIPVLLALVALVQQVASGSGSDFVTSILNTGAAAFGGR